MSTIFFYQTGQEYDIFSNVAPSPFLFNIGGIDYNVGCSEQIFQAMKNPQIQLGKQILEGTHGTSGGALQRAGQGFATNINPNWHLPTNPPKTTKNHPEPYDFKEMVMRDIILMKVTQNPQILKALLDTGNLPIVENTSIATYDDSYWGNGKNGRGRNALGKILMDVRDELREELGQYHNISVNFGFSTEVAAMLGIVSHQGRNNLDGSPVVIEKNDLDRTTAVTRTANLPAHSNSVAAPAAIQYSAAAAAAMPNPAPLPPVPTPSQVSGGKLNQLKDKAFKDIDRGKSKTIKASDGTEITYGISGRSGGFYIKGKGKGNKDYEVYISKDGNMKENNTACTQSQWGEWAATQALSHVQAKPKTGLGRFF